MWEVYAYWNVEMLELVFNALAALATNNSYLNLMVIVALLGFLAAVGVGMARIRGEEPVLWMIFMVFFYGILFVPRTTVMIVDRTAATAGAPRVVDNVPLGIAAFAGTTSKIGDWLTRQYETLFSVPDPIRFRHGMTFGAKLIRAATGAVPLDADLTRDLITYMQDCVGPDIISGHKSLEIILKTENLWAEMGGTNPARLTWINGTMMTCPDAYTHLGTRLTTAVNQTHTHLARFINSGAAARGASTASLNALLASQLPVAADVILKVSSANSLDYVRQAILVNLWRELPSANAALTDSPVAAQLAISEAQAQAASRSAYATMAAIAEEALPKVRNALQVIIMMVFPVVMLLIIAAGHKGGYIFKHYVLALLWVEMWPVIYAAVSFIMQASSSGTAMGLLGGLAAAPASSGLSLMNGGFIADEMLRTENIAGMMTLLIVPISAALLWGGAFAMTSVAASLMAPASSAAQSAGAQAGMGNFSGSNITFDVVRTHMNTGNQWSTRSNIAPGAMPGQAGARDETSSGMSTYTDGPGTVYTQGGAPVAVKPFGVSGAVAAQGGVGRSQAVTDGREATLQQREAASLVQSVTSGMSEELRAKVAEAVGQTLRHGITKRYGNSSGESSTYSTGAGETRGGSGQTTQTAREADSWAFEGRAGIGLPSGGRSAPGGGAAGAAVPGGVPSSRLQRLASSLLGMVNAGVIGKGATQEADSFDNTLSALYGLDAAKRRQAQTELGSLTQVMREIAANPREERAVREVARDLAQALERSVQASRQMETSFADTQKAGVSNNETRTGSVSISTDSATAFFRTLASRLGLDPNAPAAIHAAMAYAAANPQGAQAFVAGATTPVPQVLDQGGPGPQVTPDSLRTSGQSAVTAAHTANVAAANATNTEYQAAYAHAARAMTGLNPTPNGRIAAQAVFNKLDQERKGLEGKASEEARIARTAFGATAAAVALVQEEMRRNGKDFNKVDIGRVIEVRDHLLNAALGGPGGGGNERLRGELEKAGEHGKNLHPARLYFIQHAAGIRWSDEKRLDWDGAQPSRPPIRQNPYAGKGG